MDGSANPSWSKAKHAARDVHLDQDAAGRLLEVTSDCDPREMTVEMAQHRQTEPGLQTDCQTIKTVLYEFLVEGCLYRSGNLLPSFSALQNVEITPGTSRCSCSIGCVHVYVFSCAFYSRATTIITNTTRTDSAIRHPELEIHFH